MTDVLRNAFSIMGLMLPLTGTRATGNVRLRATGSDVVITSKEPRYLYPVVEGAMAPERIYKTAGDVTVTSAAGGTLVPVRSLVGGALHNLEAGTPVRMVEGLLDNQDGLEVDDASMVVQAGGLTGAVTREDFGGVKRVVLHEEIGPADVAQQLFLAKLGHFPAIVCTWDSASETELAVRASRHFPMRWSFFVVVSRTDSSARRRGEGLRIMGDVMETITDRCETEDREVFSSPRRLQVNGARRLVSAPSSFVYQVLFTIETTLTKREWRTFTGLQQAKLTAQTDTATPLPIVPNVIVPTS